MYTAIVMAKATTAPTSTRRENEIPRLAKKATRAAFNRAIKRGNVLVYDQGELRELDATGKITVIKKMETRSRVPKGTKLALRAPAKRKD